MYFRQCGLDVNANFLIAPKCKCGCGEYVALVLDTKQDLYDLIRLMLKEHECDYCAIFAVCLNENVVMGVKVLNEIKIYGGSSNTDKTVCDMIADIQEEFRFHCCGLLEQIDVSLYKIVME